MKRTTGMWRERKSPHDGAPCRLGSSSSSRILRAKKKTPKLQKENKRHQSYETEHRSSSRTKYQNKRFPEIVTKMEWNQNSYLHQSCSRWLSILQQRPKNVSYLLQWDILSRGCRGDRPWRSPIQRLLGRSSRHLARPKRRRASAARNSSCTLNSCEDVVGRLASLVPTSRGRWWTRRSGCGWRTSFTRRRKTGEDEERETRRMSRLSSPGGVCVCDYLFVCVCVCACVT